MTMVAALDVTDAEIITTAVCAAMFFDGNQSKACSYMKDHNLIPGMERKIESRKGSLHVNQGSFRWQPDGGRERSNAWVERCKSLVKNFDRTLERANAKLNLCFIRLMLKRLAATATT